MDKLNALHIACCNIFLKFQCSICPGFFVIQNLVINLNKTAAFVTKDEMFYQEL